MKGTEKTVEQRLLATDTSMIKEERFRTDIVVGAPHHAPYGIDTLPDPQGRPADENVGHLARYLADNLGAASVVVANAMEDPNKSMGTDYAQTILQWQPRLLLEVHGHGGRRAPGVEISAGSRGRESYAIAVTEQLTEILRTDAELSGLSICGHWEDIFFTASRTKTINQRNWLGLHVELPPQLRKADGSIYPPPRGYRFCDALSLVLFQMAQAWYPKNGSNGPHRPNRTDTPNHPVLTQRTALSQRRPIVLEAIPGRYAVCRLGSDDPLPSWLQSGSSAFASWTRTAEELSIVCEEDIVPAGLQTENGWMALRVAGTLAFDECGILAAIADPLAAATISLFVVSTHDTDYVFVQAAKLSAVVAALDERGVSVQL